MNDNFTGKFESSKLGEVNFSYVNVGAFHDLIDQLGDSIETTEAKILAKYLCKRLCSTNQNSSGLSEAEAEQLSDQDLEEFAKNIILEGHYESDEPEIQNSIQQGLSYLETLKILLLSWYQTQKNMMNKISQTLLPFNNLVENIRVGYPNIKIPMMNITNKISEIGTINIPNIGSPTIKETDQFSKIKNFGVESVELPVSDITREENLARMTTSLIQNDILEGGLKALKDTTNQIANALEQSSANSEKEYKETQLFNKKNICIAVISIVISTILAGISLGFTIVDSINDSKRLKMEENNNYTIEIIIRDFKSLNKKYDELSKTLQQQEKAIYNIKTKNKT